MHPYLVTSNQAQRLDQMMNLHLEPCTWGSESRIYHRLWQALVRKYSGLISSPYREFTLPSYVCQEKS